MIEVRISVLMFPKAPLPHKAKKKILFVSCNGLEKNRVGRSVKIFSFALFFWSKMCFMHVLR